MMSLRALSWVACLMVAAPIAADGPSGRDLMYYADNPEDNNPISGGPIECPGTMRLAGSTLSFTLSAENSGNPLKYGTVHVKLDEHGGYHDDVKLPARKPFTQRIDIAPVYGKLKTVRVDVDFFPVAGDASGATIRVTIPGTRDREDLNDDMCRRTLIHMTRPAGGKRTAYDGAYWSRTGGGTGHSVSCPANLLISGGKLSFAVPAGYRSYVVNNVPIQRNGTFEHAIKLDQVPADDVLKAAGADDAEIASLRTDTTLHVSGKVEGFTAASTGDASHSVTLEVTSDNSNARCNADFIRRGFDLGDGFVDCSKLSASQLKHHPVCSL